MSGMGVPEVSKLQLELLEKFKSPMEILQSDQSPCVIISLQWCLLFAVCTHTTCLHVVNLLSFMGLNSLRQFMFQGGSSSRRTAPLGAVFLEASVGKKMENSRKVLAVTRCSSSKCLPGRNLVSIL